MMMCFSCMLSTPIANTPFMQAYGPLPASNSNLVNQSTSDWVKVLGWPCLNESACFGENIPFVWT